MKQMGIEPVAAKVLETPAMGSAMLTEYVGKLKPWAEQQDHHGSSPVVKDIMEAVQCAASACGLDELCSQFGKLWLGSTPDGQGSPKLLLGLGLFAPVSAIGAPDAGDVFVRHPEGGAVVVRGPPADELRRSKHSIMQGLAGRTLEAMVQAAAAKGLAPRVAEAVLKSFKSMPTEKASQRTLRLHVSEPVDRTMEKSPAGLRASSAPHSRSRTRGRVFGMTEQEQDDLMKCWEEVQALKSMLMDPDSLSESKELLAKFRKCHADYDGDGKTLRETAQRMTIRWSGSNLLSSMDAAASSQQ
jgi:hypothetical protein